MTAHGPGPHRATTLALTLLLVSLVSSCALFRRTRHDEGFPKLDRSSADLYLEAAEVHYAEGRYRQAFEILVDIGRIDELDGGIRHRTELLTEDAAYAYLDQLNAEGASAGRFEDLFADRDHPRRVRVSAGVAAARVRFERDGQPLEAYETLRRVDELFPTHHERAQAGELYAEIGFHLAASDDTYLLFFDYAERAPAVLEYLVLNYPSERSCEAAYLELARIYEEDEEYSLAQERYEDLILYYPSSRHRAAAEAKVPELRLAQVLGPRYDRTELQRARRELELWLSRHPRSELRADVEATLVDNRRLLVDSDLFLAGFYARIDEPYGARLHAERALAEAEQLGDGGRAERARELIARAAAGGAADAKERLTPDPATEPVVPAADEAAGNG